MQSYLITQKHVPSVIDGGLFLIIMASFVYIGNLPIPHKYNIEAIFLTIIFVIGIVILIKNYFARRIIPSNNFTVRYIYLSFLLICISSVLAKYNYGQPLIYGLLASRRVIYSFTGMIILALLKQNRITIEKLEKLFIYSFVTTLIFYYLLNIFIPASTFLSEYSDELTKGFVSYSDARNITRYRFDLSIIFFGIIYSLLNIKNKKFLLYLLSSMNYLLFYYRGRILIVSFFFILTTYLSLASSLKTKISVFIISGIIIILFFLLNIYEYESISHFIDFFHVGLNAITQGEFGNDFSANARIIQADTAWWYIQKYHYIGVGVLSHQWSTSHHLLFKDLHPSDIGLIGLWFLYGFTGILLLGYLSIKVGKIFLSVNRKNTFILSSWLYAVYILFSSLLTGAIFITAFGQFSIMLAILTFSSFSDLNHGTKNARNIYNTHQLQ